MQCVVLAGGLGTRMKPFTETMPKALILIAGRPFLHHQMLHLKHQGVTRVLLSVGHMGDQIRAFAGNGKQWGIEIDYVDEGSQLRGTGGALRLAFEQDKLESSFLLTYGDSYLQSHASKVFQRFLDLNCDLLMTVFRNENSWDKSNALFDGQRVTLYDKAQQLASMTYIDYGMMALKRDVVRDRIPAGQASDLSQLLHSMSKEGKVYGLEVKDRFFEIGSPEGSRDLETHFLKGCSFEIPKVEH